MNGANNTFCKRELLFGINSGGHLWLWSAGHTESRESCTLDRKMSPDCGFLVVCGCDVHTFLGVDSLRSERGVLGLFHRWTLSVSHPLSGLSSQGPLPYPWPLCPLAVLRGPARRASGRVREASTPVRKPSPSLL